MAMQLMDKNFVHGYVYAAIHSKKSPNAHIGNWFVHVCEQTVSIFVYLNRVSHLETVRK